MSSLINLEKLFLKGSPNIQNLDTLATCPALVKLETDLHPSASFAVLTSSATLRKDADFIQACTVTVPGVQKRKQSVNYLKTASNCPEPDLLATRMAKAFNIVPDIKWTSESLKELAVILRDRGDGTPETWKTVLGECVQCGDPDFSEIFTGLLDNCDPGVLANRIVEPLLSVLGDVPESAREWAIELVAGVLEKLTEQRQREIGPSICLFYAKSGLDQKVREWLERITQPEAPIWKDRVLACLALRDLEHDDFSAARHRLQSMEVETEKDRVLEALAEALAQTAPAEAGEALEQITDTIRQSKLAKELSSQPVFTSDIKNVYRLLLVMESDTVALSELIVRLTDQHPDSEFVRELGKQFGAVQEESAGLSEIVDGLLESPPIKDATKKKELASFRETILGDPKSMKMALAQGLVRQMQNSGMLDEEEAQELMEELGKEL